MLGGASKRRKCPPGEKRITYYRDGKKISYCRGSPAKRSRKRERRRGSERSERRRGSERSEKRRRSERSERRGRGRVRLRWDGYPFVEGFELGDQWTDERGMTKVLAYNKRGKRDWLAYDVGLEKGYHKMRKKKKFSREKGLKSLMIAMLMKKNGQVYDPDRGDRIPPKILRQADEAVQAAKAMKPISTKHLALFDELRRKTKQPESRPVPPVKLIIPPPPVKLPSQPAPQVKLPPPPPKLVIPPPPKRPIKLPPPPKQLTAQDRSEMYGHLGGDSKALVGLAKKLEVTTSGQAKNRSTVVKLANQTNQLHSEVQAWHKSKTVDELNQRLVRIEKLNQQMARQHQTLKNQKGTIDRATLKDVGDLLTVTGKQVRKARSEMDLYRGASGAKSIGVFTR